MVICFYDSEKKESCMKLVLAVMLTLVVTSCSSLGSSGDVQQIGKDSYTVRSMGETSTKAKQAALKAANGHCTSLKRNVQLVKEEVGTEDDGSRYHDLTFLCVPGNDPDFTRVTRDQLKEGN